MVDTVRTLTDLINNLFQDGQPNGSITAQDVRDLIVSVPYLNDGCGWNFHLDSTYTSGSPRSIAAGVRTAISIDGVTENIGHPTADVFWDTTTNKVTPEAANDFMIYRFAVTAKSTVATDNKFYVELDVGGTTGVIYHQTADVTKGAGAEQAFNFNMSLFVGPDFLANGGTIYITPESDATFWEFAITSYKSYSAAP